MKKEHREDIEIENYLNSTRFTTRKELVEKTKLNDRVVRDKISNLKNRRVVICNSSRSGYRLARELRSMSTVERAEELRLVQQSLNECKSRVKKIKKSMRKYIAYLKKAEQIELEELNDNHIPHTD